ncbi:transposable element Tcb2 transposase [Trichonephila clavipes]|nr:transposable element Tcb2 transposase [Trichonephila clavipes]
MQLRRLQRQYEQLSQFEWGRIIGMMEAGWSARRVARQLGRSDCVVRRFGDQWIRDMSFTRRPGPGRPRRTSRRKDRHIVRKYTRTVNYFIGRHPGTGNTFILGPCVISNHMKEPSRRTFGIVAPITCAALEGDPSKPPFSVVPRKRKLNCSGMEPGRL